MTTRGHGAGPDVTAADPIAVASDVGDRQCDVLIVLRSFRAEGTPRMALDLCKSWLARGLRPGVLVLSSAHQDLRGAFEEQGVPIWQHEFGERGYMRYAHLVHRVWSICRSVRPLSVLSMPSGIHAFVHMGAWAARVPTRVVHQGVYPWHWKGWPFRKYQLEYALGAPFCDAVVCCSHYVAGGVQRCFPMRGGQTKVIWNGVVSSRTLPKEQDLARPATSERAVVTMVGRLDSTKDHATLLHAAAGLRARGIDLEVRFVGEGPDKDALQVLASQLDVGDRVVFCGWREDIWGELADAHVFAYMAKREEGLGIALIEAMAAGLPVVASDVDACREVLGDERSGLLVPPGDPEVLADAIEEVLKDRTAAAQRAEAAQKRAREHFSAEAMAKRYAEVLGLDTGLGRHRARSGAA